MNSSHSDSDQVLNIEDSQSLLVYLRDTGRIEPDEAPSIRVLAGGVSNRTVWVQRRGGQAWVLKQALEKLRVPLDWFSSPRRIRQEALGMRYLAQLTPPGSVPELLFEDPAHHLLAMQAVPEPHSNWKTVLLAGQVDTRLVEQFARLLASLHRRSHERAIEISQVFDDRSFFESLRLEPYYTYTAGQLEAASRFLAALVDETRACRLALVHGDYSPKNILIYEGRMVLLDHEVIHFGDPAFDIGFSLAHLLSKAHHLPGRRELFAGAALHYWQTYRQGLGPCEWDRRWEARAVCHTLACLLARVAGRSPLEYLDAQERTRQRDVVLSLLPEAPTAIPELIRQFVERL